jgi:uncharacterized membrane protein YcaP (DUF421 family)
MLFDDWTGVVRVVVLGMLAYFALIALLRISGNRTLAKMNAFDLVVTIAFGSVLATVLLSRDISLAEGIAAFALLVVLQYVIASLSIRFTWVERLVKVPARAVLWGGEFDRSAMRETRVTDDDILGAVRGAGLGDIADVAAVVLESDGSLSVVARGKAGAWTALPETLRQRSPRSAR